MSNSSNVAGRLIGYFFVAVNILCALWLGVCYLASVMHPARVKDLALFSLTTPIAIVVNVAFIIVWLFSRRWLRILYSLVALAACYKLVFTVFAFNFFHANDMDKKPNTLKIMSWNVHGMGIFDPPHNDNAAGIMSLIKRENPDILCLPEFEGDFADSTKPFANLIMAKNHYRLYRFKKDNSFGPWRLLGNAIFSHYPIIDCKYYRLWVNNYLSQYDVQVRPGKTIRFFIVHLYSFKLTDDDKRYLYEGKTKTIIEAKNFKQSGEYVNKFNRNYIIRAGEADTIAAVMKQSPYPVVICGDFNDLPASYTYTTIRGALADAFLARGAGLGRTYNLISPTIRIDHILYDSSALHCIGYKSPSVNLSDHNPVIGNFEVR